MAIVVVNYDSAPLVAANLAALSLADDYEVVLVDNDAGKAARSAAAHLAASCGWTFVPQPHNRGFGAGANAGVRVALDGGAEVVLLVNPDVSASEGALRELAAAVGPDTAVHPRVSDASGRIAFTGSVLDLRTGDTRGVGSAKPLRRALGRWRRVLAAESRDVVPWLPATCLALHRATLARLHDRPFADDFFMYWEDVELSARLRAAGVQLRVLADVEVVHDSGATQQRGAGGKSALYYRYTCRNRLLYGARMLSRRRLFLWVLATPLSSWDVLLRGGGRRRVLRDPASVRAAVRGTLEGLGVALGALARGRAADPMRSPAEAGRR